MRGWCALALLFICTNADEGQCVHALLPPGFNLSGRLLLPQAMVPICTTTTTTCSTTSTSSSSRSHTTTTRTSTSSTSQTTLSSSTTSTPTSLTSSTSSSSSGTDTTSISWTWTTTTSTASTSATTRTSTSSTTGNQTTSTTTVTTSITYTGTSSSFTFSTVTQTTSNSTSTSMTVITSTTSSLSYTTSTPKSSTSTAVTSSSSSSTSTSTSTTTSSSTSTTSSTSSSSFTKTSATSTSVSSSSSTVSTITVTRSTQTSTSSTRTATSKSTTSSTQSRSSTTSVSTTSTSATTLSTSTTRTSSVTSSSSTSTSTSSSSSSTTTTRAWCQSFLPGIPPLQDDNCTELQEGDICFAVPVNKAENETDNITEYNMSDAFGCYATRASELLCARSGVALPISQTIRCQVCGGGSFEDMEDATGKLKGTLFWGPNSVDGEIDETLLDGYDIWLVDACGEQYGHLGQVLKLDIRSKCCNTEAYNFTFDVIDMPKEHMSFMITPFKAEDRLLAGTLIPIQERTTTTTTTTTTRSATTSTATSVTLTATSSKTWTSSFTTTSSTTVTTVTTLSTSTVPTTTETTYIPISAVLRGCFGLSVVNPLAFIAKPEAKEAIKQVIAKAAGPEVEYTYVQDVLFQEGEACTSRRLSRSKRRLQEGPLRADYVIVVPPTPATESLGGAEAIGQRAKSIIQLVSVQQATTWLNEELQRHSSLRNFTASITHISSIRLQTAVDPLIIPSGGYERVIEAEQQAYLIGWFGGLDCLCGDDRVRRDFGCLAALETSTAAGFSQ
ncbi:unnamed protein product [Durusdinium trenchii]|uniref:Uncharacterized protein n=1 Tax=Durusdinium trenchii TaxID=1381693 RepID=A0ABP0PSI6_9DINO